MNDKILYHATLHKIDPDSLKAQVEKHIESLPFSPMPHEVEAIIISFCRTNEPPKRDKIFDNGSQRDRVDYLERLQRRHRSYAMMQRTKYDERSEEMSEG